MIVNNYTNTLPENKESQLSLTSLANPVILIRMFEFNLIKDETHLVIPYYVSDYNHEDFINEKISPTFTTVITLDEDTVPADEVRVWKKTTYAGEHSIDLGTFDTLGLHTINIRTIQSNGIGSHTKLIKFFVRKPAAQRTTVDLSNGGSFSTSLNGYTRYYSIPISGPQNVFALEYNCTYNVSCTKEGDDVVDIQIVVARSDENKKCITAYSLSGLEKNNVLEDYSDDCAGTYHLTTRCSVNGTVKQLTDYLNTKTSSLPRSVIEAASKNKIAMNRLFEAARAYGADILKLPNMDIVCDYHLPKNYSTDNSITPATSYDDSIQESSIEFARNRVTIPNGLTVDLNGSNVQMLPSSSNYKGRLFSLSYCLDSHLINGRITGNWLNSTPAYGGDGEHRSTLEIRGSQFCSFEDLVIKGTSGYDVMVSARACHGFATGTKVYNKRGFIDYDGVVHDEENVYNSNFPSYTGCFMYEDTPITSLIDSAWCIDNHVVRFGNSEDNTGNISLIHSQTCRTVNASFYDEDNNFIKTVKTYERTPTLVPYGAAKVRLCKYGIAGFGDVDSVNYSASSGRFGCSYRDVVGWGNGIYRCDMHTARQVVFANGSTQLTLKDCRLFGVNCERNSNYTWSSGPDSSYVGVLRNPATDADPNGLDIYSIYPTWVVDIEDISRESYYCFWDNIEVVYGTIDAIRLDAGTGWHFKNCHNLHISLGRENVDCLIENCAVTMSTDYSWVQDKGLLMIKNSIIDSFDNGIQNVSARGATSGDVYLRNSSIYRYGDNGSLNHLVHDEPKNKM